MSATPPLDPRLNAFRQDLADAALRPFIEVPRYVEGKIRQCIRGVTPLFLAPENGAQRISELRYGEFIDVFEERDDGFSWVQSRTDRMVGYIETRGAYNESIAAMMNRINVPRTFLYAQASRDAPVKDCLTLGSTVSLAGEEGDFYPLINGGFVAKRHVAPSDEAFCADYVFTAGQLLGAPFLVGGRTPLGTDASGLVQLALALADIDAPRTVDQQRERFGLPLPCHWRDVVWKRGDLVFFENPEHIGIMTGETHILAADPELLQVAAFPLDTLVQRGARIIAAGHP